MCRCGHPGLSDVQHQRFQLRAVAAGDVYAADRFGGIGNSLYHHENLTAAAAHGGKLVTLRWLRSERCGWGATTCSEAARGGHQGVLQ